MRIVELTVGLSVSPPIFLKTPARAFFMTRGKPIFLKMSQEPLRNVQAWPSESSPPRLSIAVTFKIRVNSRWLRAPSFLRIAANSASIFASDLSHRDAVSLRLGGSSHRSSGTIESQIGMP